MKAILTYHSIDESGSPISLPDQTFDAHLRWLCTGRVRVLDLERLAAHPTEGSDAVALTFDDGFENTKGPVERLLKSGLPVTLFVVSGHVGRTNAWGGRDQVGIPTLRLLEWNDLDRLAAQGAHVAAHTRTHVPLTTVSNQQLEDELHGSLEDLTAKLGACSPQISYPYGDVDERVAARAARYFGQGLTTEHRLLQNGDDRTRLPRLDMYYFRRIGALEAWGSGRFQRWIDWCRAKRTVRSRLARIGMITK